MTSVVSPRIERGCDWAAVSLQSRAWTVHSTEMLARRPFILLHTCELILYWVDAGGRKLDVPEIEAGITFFRVSANVSCKLPNKLVGKVLNRRRPSGVRKMP